MSQWTTDKKGLTIILYFTVHYSGRCGIQHIQFITLSVYLQPIYKQYLHLKHQSFETWHALTNKENVNNLVIIHNLIFCTASLLLVCVVLDDILPSYRI